MNIQAEVLVSSKIGLLPILANWSAQPTAYTNKFIFCFRPNLLSQHDQYLVK